MTGQEVADLLGVSLMTVYNYGQAGKIAIKERISNRKTVYDDDSVYAFMKKSQGQPNKIIVTYNGSKVVVDATPELAKAVFDLITKEVSHVS